MAPVDLHIEQPANIEGKAVTFWRYEPRDNAVELHAAQIAEPLFRLHSKLASLRDHAAFPSFGDRLTSAVDDLERRERALELAEADRALLRETLLDGMSRRRR
jgi:hypothetical protein